MFGVRAKNSADKNALLWINFCKSDRVKAPTSPDDAIPVVVLEPSTQPVNNGEGKATLYDAVLAPSVFDRIDADAKFKTDLIEVGLECVEERSKTLDKWPTVKIDPASVRVRDKPYTRRSMKDKLEEAAATMTKPFEMQVPGSAPAAAAAAVSGATTPSSHVVMPTAADPTGSAGGGSSAAPEIIIPGLNDGKTTRSATSGDAVVGSKSSHAEQPKKSVVIEELASTVSEQGTDGDAIVPTHSCVYDEAGRALAVTVDLPGVGSVNQIVLDVEPRRLSLTAEGGYALELNLPKAVDVDSVRAKFRKKRQQLQLTLSVPP
jgi:hypothetical protein